MLNLIAAIRRKPGMTHQAYLHYLQHVHGSLAAANPLRISRYVQNHVFDSSFGTEEDPAYLTEFGRDSVTELHFEDMEALAVTMSDPYSREVIGPDGANFNDLPSALALLTRPVVLVPPPTSSEDDGPVKVLHFLRMPEGPGPDDFDKRWRAAHEAALAEQESHAKALRGCVQYWQAHGAEKALRHFGGGGEPAYTGITTLYYDSPDEALTHFPSYERALRQHSAENDDCYDPSRSFALYSREVIIFQQS
ncbi:EthD domain-containing protein [Streptomyces cylindrosporus]|uniref:EthD domain-containing protein n=1 Tax=Streptomyces cylindrosporus TaxID=2927583 RepID=A0ABS9Y0F8_9ACTN|nr:EthD domain-containing protein [Streptomyces cylindrosporus]MCI3270711.1 EthD domain-containing protein [Streptomyces cylindrosporus]